MQDQIETAKIKAFLAMVTPIVVDVVRAILQTLDFKVKEEGAGLKLAFSIKKDGKEAKFYFHNLLLEIATIDRDQQALRFDESLRDFDYFLAKMARMTESKLNILFRLFGEQDMEAAIESIAKDAKRYERIRIWRFDLNDSEQKAR
jgi:hypothetical protein